MQAIYKNFVFCVLGSKQDLSFVLLCLVPFDVGFWMRAFFDYVLSLLIITVQRQSKAKYFLCPKPNAIIRLDTQTNALCEITNILLVFYKKI